MTVKPDMSSRFRPLAALAAASLLAGAVLRSVLWWEFGLDEGVAAGELPSILARGVLNDLVVALYAFTPFVLYLALIPERWIGTRANRLLITIGAWLTLFAIAFLAVVERFFFQEFDARFNLVAFDYLMYPTEVAGDIWTEYPVVWTAIAAASIASVGLVVMRRWMPGRAGTGA